MNCKYALRHLYSESISIRKKHLIDEHIADCSYCQNEIINGKEVSSFLLRLGLKLPMRREELLKSVQKYREVRRSKWWYRLKDIFPIEPAFQRAVVYGAAAAVIIFSVFVTKEIKKDTKAVSNQTESEEIDFYLREHISNQGTDILAQDAFTRSFIMLYSPQSESKYPKYNGK